MKLARLLVFGILAKQVRPVAVGAAVHGEVYQNGFFLEIVEPAVPFVAALEFARIVLEVE